MERPVHAGAVLAAALLGGFVIALDALIVTVALPDVRRELHAGMAGTQWAVDGYTLPFAALMLSAGAVADRFGARRVFAAGIALFAVASAACGLAPTAGALIGARVVQGAAAAVVMPATLALLREAFPDAARRARALGAWTAGASVAAAAGPVLGGVLVTGLGWRWVFLVNLPVAAAALVLLRSAGAVGVVSRRGAPLDGAGQGLVAAGLGLLAFGVIEGRVWATAAGPLLVAAFLWRQGRIAHPLVPLALLRSRTVAAALAVGFAVNAAFYGGVFVMTLWFQQVAGASALLTGVLFLPMTALISAVNLAGPRLAARFGPRAVVAGGQLLLLAGLLALALVGPGAAAGLPVWAAALLLAPVGVGCGVTVPVVTAQMLGAVPAERAGMASGLFNTVRQLAGALAVAVFGVLVAGGSFAGFAACWWIAGGATAAGVAALLLAGRVRPEGRTS
ncbi:MFS transporter [Mangrovactinospora gilvigrisea]|uniref:MFS transporter n=1 Tax=Mangrovactinospora gilvigrisea TaxID=1428644 RepID=A0A1J7BGL5_9ACTN|nr:MFS transporter [Mangrovactinospora gilvigrisea]